MKNSNLLLVVILLLAVALNQVHAAESWMSRASVTVDWKGLVDTVLPPELHRMPNGSPANAGLDLSLVGPDGNSRAFELYMRCRGELETMRVVSEKETLLDDGRILWEAPLAPDYLFNSLSFFVNATNMTGKVDVEGRLEGVWQVLATGSLLNPQGGGSATDVKFAEAAYDRIRCHFTGFDKHFRQAAIFVQSVEVTGRKTGSDYAYFTLTPEIEQTTTEDGLEARIFLPGSGLRLEQIEVITAAQFKGDWQTGREKISLGRREFMPIDGGRVTSISEEQQKLVIDYPRIWEHRVLLLRMRSSEYFGQIEQVKVKVRLPRILFSADQEGEYSLQTGKDSVVSVRENPESSQAGNGRALTFGTPVDNTAWEAESILKNYSSRGGPFKIEGYRWQAPFAIEKPGFYQLVTSENVNLDPYPAALRIVKDAVQVPYFVGATERRELEIAANSEYDQAGNRTFYILKLPEKMQKPAAIKFKAAGIFTRTLRFEKHDYGQISWQPWKEVPWVNRSEKETEFILGLSQFPEDQKEIRLTVEHGSNQPLEIRDFKGFYAARDLFFVASEPGVYSLMGGNAAATAPQYDLAIVEDALSELAPTQVQPGLITPLASGSVPMVASEGASVEQGAPFNDAGYSWVATFTVAEPGFCQLSLNLKAALDSNPDGIRLVKNGLQIPYFPGMLSQSEIDLKYSSEYNRDKNSTQVTIELPVASKQWRSLKFFSSGVFSRNLILEIAKPGKIGWKTFKTSTWVNRNDSDSGFSIDLDRLPEGERQFRLLIAHGDNSPIELKAVKGIYQSKTLLFKAVEAGEYRIYGGNPAAKAASYDLAMIKDSLLTREPQRIQLGEPAEYSGSSQVGKHIEEAFSDRGWGIYAVLGLVTALLLVIIVKIFPEQQQASDESAAPKPTQEPPPSQSSSSQPSDVPPPPPPTEDK